MTIADDKELVEWRSLGADLMNMATEPELDKEEFGRILEAIRLLWIRK